MAIMYDGGDSRRRELDAAMRHLSGLRFMRRRFGADAVSDAEFERAVARVNREAAAAGLRDTVDLDAVLAQVAEPLDMSPSQAETAAAAYAARVRRTIYVRVILIVIGLFLIMMGIAIVTAPREAQTVPAPVAAPPPVVQRELVVQTESVVDVDAEARRVRAIVEAAAARARREGG